VRDIEAIKRELEATEKRLAALRDEFDEARLRGCPVKPGMLVRERHGPERREFVVSRVVPWGDGLGAAYGRKMKKNGEPGARSVFIGSTNSVDILRHP